MTYRSAIATFVAKLFVNSEANKQDVSYAMLNDILLEAFINGFYGFGNYQARYWFIGMEEGGGNTFDAISKQLDIWDKWGRKELIDVAEYAREMNIMQWYGERPKLQPTWKHLIRIFLTAEGQPVDAETMRQYQKTLWGTEDGNTCLLELLPLPAPNIGSWLYGEISTLPYLKSRQTYREYVVGSRIAHLQNRITQYQPKAVVLYGSGYDSYWKRIGGIDTWERLPEGVTFAVNNSTLFISSKHPVAYGATNEYFYSIGKLIKELKSVQP